MLKVLLSQTGWNILGTIFGFGVGFFVKMFLINKVGASSFGLYIIATSFEAAIGTIVALSIPTIILKFLPTYINQGKLDKATTFSSKFMLYSLVVGLLGGVFTLLFSSVIAIQLFDNESLTAFIALAAFYIPISMFTAYLTSVYRSVLKIKEIILFSTLYMVSTRAILTFIVFSFTDDILYFMYIEIFALSTAAVLLYMNFKSDKLKMFTFSKISIKVVDNEIWAFGKRMYMMSLLSFASGYIMMFLMSITLPSKSIGIYAILMTIAGLTSFLLSNINRVFSPIISSLVAQKNFRTLSMIYKESTFLINVITIPFIVIVLLFSEDILALYGDEFKSYTFELMILFLGNYASISVGSSGTMMVMAGLEKESLYIQITMIIGIFASSILLLSTYGLFAAVLISAVSLFILNLVEVFLIHKKLDIFPLDRYSFLLFILFISAIYIIQLLPKNGFETWEYFLYPIFIYSMYLGFFYKKILHIMSLVKKGEYA
jgi:O-antigen/teichoic acid export membrane protein